jgi:hypothetical protein
VTDPEASALEALGLRKGEEVRFRRADRARWQLGSLTRLERDGNLRVTDADGAARTVSLADLQVWSPRSRRGRVTWEAAAERAGRAEQLTLLW